jgi:iron(III) transport system ATP-binding protein
MAVSDTIGVFNLGRLIQLGKPFDIYANPRSLFVADFIGKANFFPVSTEKAESGAVKVHTKGGSVIEGVPLRQAARGEESWFDAAADLMLMARPERMWIAASGKPQVEGPVLTGTAQRVQFLGTFVRYIVDAPEASRPVIIDTPAFVEGVGEGSPVTFGFAPSDAIAFGKPA